MSDDATYDIMQRGGKIRVLSSEQWGGINISEPKRELTPTMSGEAVRKVKDQLDDMNRRVDRLNQQRSPHQGSIQGGNVEYVAYRTPEGNLTGSRDLETPEPETRVRISGSVVYGDELYGELQREARARPPGDPPRLRIKNGVVEREDW